RLAMALSAGGFQVARRKQRLLPGKCAAVRLFHGRCHPLPSMTHHAAELVELVRYDRMSPERLQAHVGQAGFLQSNVAGRTSVHDPKFGMPDLLDSPFEVTLQSHGLAASANHAQVGILVVTPFAKVVFGRRDSQRNENYDAKRAKGTNGITK